LQMSIYLLGNRLFMYVLAEDHFDWQTSFAEYQLDPKCNEWQRLMDELMATVPEAPGVRRPVMEEVYHLGDGERP